MSPSSHRITTGMMSALLALLASCRSAPTRLYSLEPIAPGGDAVQRYDGPPLRIDAVHVPPGLDRIELVRENGAGQYDIDDLSHWSAPLGEAMRQTLTADLIARLRPGLVIFPHLQKSAAALGVTVDVLQIHVGPSSAWLQASWSVGQKGPGDARRDPAVLLRCASGGTDPRSTARAMSELTADLAGRIAASL